MQCPHHPFNQKHLLVIVVYNWVFGRVRLKSEPLQNPPNLKGCLSHAMNPSWTCDQQPEPASSARLPGVFVAPSGRIGRSWAGFSVRQKLEKVFGTSVVGQERCRRDSSHGNLGAFFGGDFCFRRPEVLGEDFGDFFSKDLTRPTTVKPL